MPATFSFEIELTLTGDVCRGEPDTRDNPGFGTYVPWVEIEGLGSLDWAPAGSKERFVTTSLLDGVDVTSPDIQRLFANVIALKRSDLESALMDDELARAA